MQAMGQFSGDSSNAKIADILAQERFEPSDYVRLYTIFGTSQSNSLPTLWAFLLIALGLALLSISIVSFSMHWVQRRGRRDLQRRVESGEVDLESLGIKRSRIPQEAIDLLETSLYTQHEEDSNKEDIPAAQPSENSIEQQTLPVPPGSHTRYSQTTCPICLDDFIPNTTTVRSLPCHHIYHPSCIDPFLRANSSLCPLCKTRVLPSNSIYQVSEPITNYMVRHERRLRRVRQQRGEAGEVPESGPATREQGANGRWVASLRRGYRVGRRAFSAPSGPVVATPTTSQIEMGRSERRATSGPLVGQVSAQRTDTLGSPPAVGSNGTEWMRRLNILHGNETTVDEDEAERVARLSGCESTTWLQPAWVVETDIMCVGRRAVGVVFPGFR